MENEYVQHVSAFQEFMRVEANVERVSTIVIHSVLRMASKKLTFLSSATTTPSMRKVLTAEMMIITVMNIQNLAIRR